MQIQALRNPFWTVCFLFSVLFAEQGLGQEPRAALKEVPDKLNVLFIAVDDLRPELGCYGSPMVKSPNIDALAESGMVFTRAYCQQAVCTPSRTSLLTGLRPDSTKVHGLFAYFRNTIPDVVTLPEYFKRQGYHTQAFGKVYHRDDPQSWSVPTMPGKHVGEDGPAWSAPDLPDSALGDGQVADWAIQALGQAQDRPFFVAVGFRKPHLPFVAPKKYYDLYPLEMISPAANAFPPRRVPPIALTDWVEFHQYEDILKLGRTPDETARALVRGYYAAISYTDAQVGRLLAELDRLGLRDETIIVFWSDHGFHLGENGLWCKNTNFEVATRVPLIFSVPAQQIASSKSDALVELVDVYPTLCELAGLPIPPGLEGISLVPLLKNPKRPWKQAAFSQFPRGRVMGYSMRTDRYRYTEWAEPNQEPIGIELYDHRSDGQENVNIANLPENAELVAELSRKLRAGWKATLPPSSPLPTQ